MYIADFDEFMAASVKLFQSNPTKTRYLMKFRGEDKVVVLKVTDDKVRKDGADRVLEIFFFFFFFLFFFFQGCDQA
jgi:hypothetical protein